MQESRRRPEIKKQMLACFLCPRRCGANRWVGELGQCGADANLHVARAALHFWEEPSISGKNGSGAVFFSGCNLSCVYCQNYEISHLGFGEKITPKRLSSIFLELQAQGAHNINLVTGTHFVPQIAYALSVAKRHGLAIPVVYNTSAYELPDTLKQLEGLVDIYLPDLKYKKASVSQKYSSAPDYFEIASAAIDCMVKQVGPPQFAQNGLLKKGVIVRHLMLPGQLFDSKHIVEYLYATYRDSIFISLMNQFTPNGRLLQYPELCRPLVPSQYEAMINFAVDLGVKNAYVQEGGTVSESFVPLFDLTGVL